MGAVHPAATSQGTNAGKALTALAVIDSRVYAGYGDYDANTGPIHVESVSVSDPLGAWTDHVTADTEQVDAISGASNARVFVPHLDPRTGGRAGYAERQTDGTWVDRPSVIAATGAIHVFDMAEHGGKLWACGAAEVQPTPTADGQAVVWCSTDNGATWIESLRDPHLDPFSRFYFLAPIGDTLYAHNRKGHTTFAWTEAGGWVTASLSLLPVGVDGAPGEPWQDGYVIPSSVLVGRDNNITLYYFDGSGDGVAIPNTAAWNPCAWAIAPDDSLCLLTTDGLLRRAAAAPLGDLAYVSIDAYLRDAYLRGNVSSGYSMAVLPNGSEAVVGLATSRLAKVPLPALT